jgi:cysteinyl-tRNA synthetase
MAVTALANITNSAINAGKQLVSSLTIDPIKLGFQEYETQINAIQTILANTSSKGTTLEQVNSALDELNKYADKTIYNFTEMTRNIGTFTAAGVDLNTSVQAIKGIANLAAISGSNAQQASTAMYQLSQALATGTVKLMIGTRLLMLVWRSSISGCFERNCSRSGIAIDQMIKDGYFRETLQKGWLTSES